MILEIIRETAGEKMARLAFHRISRALRCFPGLRWCLPVLLVSAAGPFAYSQEALPNAPTPQTAFTASLTEAGDLADDPNPGAPAGGQAFPPAASSSRSGLPVPGLQPNYVPTPRPCVSRACSPAQPLLSCCVPNSATFSSYLSHNAIHIYTPAELGRIAIHGIVDPFNLLTIAGTSAISIATDSHGLYGPGVYGWAKLSGVTLTEDMTGEFFGTFLIPSIDHQDPHYHRMPNASMKRRLFHCVYQPFWTQSDTGRGMVNYSTIVGSMADEAVDISYVPYQKVGWGASAARIASGWASAPIGNFVTEFVPDLASHVNFNIVFLQRIVNRVALEEGAGSP